MKIYGINILCLVLCLIFVSINFAFADDFSKIRKGNREYNRKKYDKALEYYQNLETKAVPSWKKDFNMGNIYYKILLILKHGN